MSHDVLLRIEANKQAALQRRRAAEALQQRDGGASPISTSQAHPVSLQSTVQLQPAVAPADASETRQPAKRHWGLLGAVADDEDD